MSYRVELEKLRKTFDDIAGLAWGYIDYKDEDAGATYAMACVDLLEEVAHVIEKEFNLTTESDETFLYLYTSKILKKDYSELYSELSELQSSTDYGRLVSEVKINLEDNLSTIEQMFDDLIALKQNNNDNANE